MTLSISSWHFRWYSGFSAKEYRIQEMALAVVSWPETTNQSNTVNYSGICFQISLAFCNLLLAERFWLFFFCFWVFFAVPSNMNVSTSFRMSSFDIPFPSSSLAVNRMSKKSKYLCDEISWLSCSRFKIQWHIQSISKRLTHRIKNSVS